MSPDGPSVDSPGVAHSIGRDPPNGTRRPNEVRARVVVAAAASMYRRFPERVLGTALVVFPVVMLVEVLLHRAMERAVEDAHPPGAVTAALVVASSGAVIAFGELLFSGVIDESVGATLAGARLPPIVEVVRSLPMTTLLLADVVLLLLAGLTSSLLLPELAVVTFTCITGPVIIVERRSALASLWRSSVLIAPRFWTALAAVGVPIAIEAAIVAAVVQRAGDAGIAAVVSFGAAFGVTIGAMTGLCEVVLGRTLIELDAAAAR